MQIRLELVIQSLYTCIVLFNLYSLNMYVYKIILAIQSIKSGCFPKNSLEGSFTDSTKQLGTTCRKSPNKMYRPVLKSLIN